MGPDQAGNQKRVDPIPLSFYFLKYASFLISSCGEEKKTLDSDPSIALELLMSPSLLLFFPQYLNGEDPIIV